jgi:transient receptor potential cation channel subfamily A member 1
LSHFLDSCITKCSSDAESNIDYYMVIDYSFLKASEEMPPINYMTKATDVQPLIKHPVIASILFLKWFRLSTFFYLNLLLTTFNAVSFIAYLMMFYVHHVYVDPSNHTLYEVMHYLAIGSFVIFSAKEFSIFMSSPKSYLSSLVNYFEMVFMGLMAVALFQPLGDQQYHRLVAALLYLGFAIEWTMMLSELPMFSVCNYLVMLKKVAINFIRTLTFYSTILMAFAGSFYTLTNKTEKSMGNFTTDGSNSTMEAKNPDEFTMFSVVFHVFLMLTGDFNLITGKGEDFTIGRVFLLVFVLSMSIVMMNLLIGLTVSDTAAIEAEAEWYKWWMRAKLLGKYDIIASNW